MKRSEVTDVERRCGGVRLLAVLRLMCPEEEELSGGASTIDPRFEEPRTPGSGRRGVRRAGRRGKR